MDLAAFTAASRARNAANNAERPAALAERGLSAKGHGIVAQVLGGTVVQHIHVNGCWGECGATFPKDQVVPVLLDVTSPAAIRKAALAPCVGR